jgi:hypothetical protein
MGAAETLGVRSSRATSSASAVPRKRSHEVFDANGSFLLAMFEFFIFLA